MTELEPSRVRRSLRAWYGPRRSSYPWRTDPPDPYAVLVSEVMLQQTQASRVAPVFERFLERFPDVRALARASRADVLRSWAGLGYHRRAVALHAAARTIVDRFGGPHPGPRSRSPLAPGRGAVHGRGRCVDRLRRARPGDGRERPSCGVARHDVRRPRCAQRRAPAARSRRSRFLASGGDGSRQGDLQAGASLRALSPRRAVPLARISGRASCEPAAVTLRGVEPRGAGPRPRGPARPRVRRGRRVDARGRSPARAGQNGPRGSRRGRARRAARPVVPAAPLSPAGPGPTPALPLA
jgi:hypothetical protein